MASTTFVFCLHNFKIIILAHEQVRQENRLLLILLLPKSTKAFAGAPHFDATDTHQLQDQAEMNPLNLSPNYEQQINPALKLEYSV